LGEGAFLNGFDGFAVNRHRHLGIFWRATTPFDFQDLDTRIQNPIQEGQSAKVFGRHDVFIVKSQLKPILALFHIVTATTQLHTSPTIGGRIVDVLA